MLNKAGYFKKQNVAGSVLHCTFSYLVGKEVHLCDSSILIMETHELHTWSSIPDHWLRTDWICDRHSAIYLVLAHSNSDVQ